MSTIGVPNRFSGRAANTTDLNSWWGQNNQRYLQGHNGVPITNITAAERPGDWDAFRQQFGGGMASENDYTNWSRGQQRESTMADFVDRMAGQDSGINQFTSQMQGDYGQYKGELDKYLGQAGPQVRTDNRFETGLSANEARLNRLLEDPDSVQQTAAYKFRLNQGQDAVQRQLAAKGMLGSGNRLMELTKYGQDMASQEYDNQAKRLSDLVGNYSQSWLGDKNANTQQYLAESQAWNQRGGLLKDIMGQAQTGLTSAQKIGADQRLGWADAWTKQAPKPFQEHQNGGLRTWNYG